MHTMKPTKALMDYDLSPRIFPSGQSVTATIRPLGDHVAFEEGAAYYVRIMPMEQGIEPKEISDFDGIEVVAKDGKLTFVCTLQGEQEHYLRLYKMPDNAARTVPLTNQRAYSLLPDLYARRPYKGDLHVHSHHSDGHESPAVVAANYRKAGFDFMGLTDHRRYEPSLEAIAAYRDAPIDLALFPGEEVHLDNPYHIINFGGSFSLNAYYRENAQAYRDQVAAIAATLQLPEGLDPAVIATMVWAFNKIRQTGGLAIFPHPHWISSVYHVPDEASRYLFRQDAFDAFELLGGQEASPNNMQVAFWQQMRSEGCAVPVVGSSDSHGTVDAPYFLWCSTIVFSPSLAWDDVRTSITDDYSVAVESYPGEEPRLYGSYRMVKYAMFLWDTYFVLHDESCFEEGRQMKQYVAGEREAAHAMLGAMQGRAGKLLAHWWGEK